MALDNSFLMPPFFSSLFLNVRFTPAAWLSSIGKAAISAAVVWGEPNCLHTEDVQFWILYEAHFNPTMTRFEIGLVVLNKTAACVGLSLFVNFSVSIILPSSLFSVSLHVSSSLCQFEFNLPLLLLLLILSLCRSPFHLFQMHILFSHISPNY